MARWDALEKAERSLRQCEGGISYTDVTPREESYLAELVWDRCESHMDMELEGAREGSEMYNMRVDRRVARVLGAMAFNTTSNAQAQATLQAISGNNYAGFSTSMVQGMQLFMNNFANQSGGGGSPMSNRVALAEACDVACDSTTPPKWGAWGGALGGLGTVGAGQSVVL